MLTKFFEFYESHKSYFVTVLMMMVIVMAFGIFNVTIVGVCLSVILAIFKEIYDKKRGGNISIVDLAMSLTGIVFGGLISLLGNI